MCAKNPLKAPTLFLPTQRGGAEVRTPPISGRIQHSGNVPQLCLLAHHAHLRPRPVPAPASQDPPAPAAPAAPAPAHHSHTLPRQKVLPAAATHGLRGQEGEYSGSLFIGIVTW